MCLLMCVRIYMFVAGSGTIPEVLLVLVVSI